VAERTRASFNLGEIIRRQRELAELPMRQLAAMVGGMGKKARVRRHGAPAR
jgi:hypothetical protein